MGNSYLPSNYIYSSLAADASLLDKLGTSPGSCPSRSSTSANDGRCCGASVQHPWMSCATSGCKSSGSCSLCRLKPTAPTTCIGLLRCAQGSSQATSSYRMTPKLWTQKGSSGVILSPGSKRKGKRSPKHVALLIALLIPQDLRSHPEQTKRASRSAIRGCPNVNY